MCRPRYYTGCGFHRRRCPARRPCGCVRQCQRCPCPIIKPLFAVINGL